MLNAIPISPEAEEAIEENSSEVIIKNDISNMNNEYKTSKKIINQDKDKKEIQINEYIESKNKIINENTFRKYTFPINTIYKYKYDYCNHKLVIDE